MYVLACGILLNLSNCLLTWRLLKPFPSFLITIAASYFLQRRRIHGRLVRVIENTEPVKGE